MEHLPLQATPEQRDNLKKLADYLLSGQLKAKFDMTIYCSFNDGHDHWETDCGTVGCAAGHGPHAGIPKLSNEYWPAYVRRCFIERDALYFWGSNSFEWIFSSEWAGTDNTPQGAAKRILYALKNGIPIDHDFNPEIYEKAD